jgi:N utilization substance protein A
VVNELRGEKIDVIRWSPDPATYISNALSPARVDEVRLVNPDERQAHVLVPEDQLSLAIGKEGQNVRLAARLTGWKIDIKDAGKYDYEAEDRKLAELQAAREAAEAEAKAKAAEAEAKAAAARAAREAKMAAIAAAAAEVEAELEAGYLSLEEESVSPTVANATATGAIDDTHGNGATTDEDMTKATEEE